MNRRRTYRPAPQRNATMLEQFTFIAMLTILGVCGAVAFWAVTL